MKHASKSTHQGHATSHQPAAHQGVRLCHAVDAALTVPAEWVNHARRDAAALRILNDPLQTFTHPWQRLVDPHVVASHAHHKGIALLAQHAAYTSILLAEDVGLARAFELDDSDTEGEVCPVDGLEHPELLLLNVQREKVSKLQAGDREEIAERLTRHNARPHMFLQAHGRSRPTRCGAHVDRVTDRGTIGRSQTAVREGQIAAKACITHSTAHDHIVGPVLAKSWAQVWCGLNEHPSPTEVRVERVRVAHGMAVVGTKLEVCSPSPRGAMVIGNKVAVEEEILALLSRVCEV